MTYLPEHDRLEREATLNGDVNFLRALEIDRVAVSAVRRAREESYKLEIDSIGNNTYGPRTSPSPNIDN